ncbi:hypothetical protein B0H17DRAFT_1281048 [Mycena rosella]|uniref:Uncharacterized protein n=1 Tax=Mycena rosella TaxID=1033263 RepID=A0AAD7GXK8_MYCRO|nr:hypothetical protein B0H17DRAFT_1281048 [Mycena rosella]
MSSGTKLKVQGNALFSAKNFKEADKKYTQAIQASDDSEAADQRVGGALCQLRRMYLDASNDAKKATLLDPAYLKAFVRVATAEDALGNYQESTKNWQLALNVLPKFNLTPREQTQMVQYQAGLTTMAAEVVKIKIHLSLARTRL